MNVGQVEGYSYFSDGRCEEVGTATPFAVPTGPAQAAGTASHGSASIEEAFAKPENNMPSEAERQDTDRLAKELVARVKHDLASMAKHNAEMDKLDAVWRRNRHMGPRPTFPAYIEAWSKRMEIEADLKRVEKSVLPPSVSLPLRRAASSLALANLVAEQSDLPEDRKEAFLDVMRQKLFDAVDSSEFTTPDQRAKFARLLIDGAYVHALPSHRAALAGLVGGLTRSPHPLSDTTQEAFKTLIFSSRLAQGTPDPQPFVRRYVEAIVQSRSHWLDRMPAAAAAFGEAIVKHGEEGEQFPTAAALDNAIGRALGLTEEQLPKSDSDRKAARQNHWELFSGKQLARVRHIARTIRAIGGPDARVTFLPLVFQVAPPPQTQPETHFVFKVTGGGETRFVDEAGDASDDITDLLPKLGYGVTLFPQDGKLTIAEDGSVPFATFVRPQPSEHTPPARPGPPGPWT